MGANNSPNPRTIEKEPKGLACGKPQWLEVKSSNRTNKRPEAESNVPTLQIYKEVQTVLIRNWAVVTSRAEIECILIMHCVRYLSTYHIDVIFGRGDLAAPRRATAAGYVIPIQLNSRCSLARPLAP